MIKPKKRLVRAKLKEDRFVIFTAKAETWLETHRKEVLYGISGLILIVAAGFVFNWSKADTEKKAAYEELLARDAYTRAALDSALIRSDVIIDDYSGASSAGIALMIKGRVNEARGDFDKAIEAYEKVIDDFSNQEYVGFGAYYALGTIALGRSEYEKASEYYGKAASNFPKHFSAPDALIETAKAQEKAGHFAQAKTAYRKILSDYPKSRSADIARDNLAKLEFMP